MWKQFAEKMKFRIDLDDYGLNGCWVDVIPISALPYAEVRAMSAQEAPTDQEFLKVLSKCILDWNLPDLPKPSENPDVLWQLPTALINFLAEEVGKQAQISRKRQKGSS